MRRNLRAVVNNPPAKQKRVKWPRLEPGNIVRFQPKSTDDKNPEAHSRFWHIGVVQSIKDPRPQGECTVFDLTDGTLRKTKRNELVQVVFGRKEWYRKFVHELLQANLRRRRCTHNSLLYTIAAVRPGAREFWEVDLVRHDSSGIHFATRTLGQINLAMGICL